jgi:hypothetical protein
MLVEISQKLSREGFYFFFFPAPHTLLSASSKGTGFLSCGAGFFFTGDFFFMG